MNKILQFSFLLILLNLAACGKNDDDNPGPEQAGNCRLAKLNFSDNNNNSAETLITYNAAGYATEIKEGFKESQGTTYFRKYTYTYNSENQLIEEVYTWHDTLKSQTVFEYTNSLLSKTTSTWFDPINGNDVYERNYVYDAKKRIKELTYPNAGNQKEVFEYDGNGNLISIIGYYGNYKSYYSKFSNYDNKPNYYTTMQGVHKPYQSIYFFALGQLMKNNPGVFRFGNYDHMPDGSVQEVDDVAYTYRYTYGENGLPVSYIQGTDYAGTFSELTANLAYDCK